MNFIKNQIISDNFRYKNLNEIIFKSKKLSRYKLKDKILFDNNKILLNDD